MADALKDMFNKKFYEHLAMEFNTVDKHFRTDNFVKDVTKGLDSLSLNQRLRNTTVTLKKHLPDDYKKSVEILSQVVPKFQSHYTSFLFPDFVGQYGHDDFNLSMEALKYFTQFSSSEFAIREFLKKTPVSYPIVIGGLEGSNLSKQLGNTQGALPYTIIINSKGKAVFSKLGKISEDELRKAIKEAI